jgi:hypothetical protein
VLQAVARHCASTTPLAAAVFVHKDRWHETHALTGRNDYYHAPKLRTKTRERL